MAKSKKKGPSVAISPLDKKQPRISSEPPSFRGGVLCWQFNGVDKNGPFAWTNLSDGNEFMAVIDTLSNLETMPEEVQKQRGCHFIPAEGLSKEARDRLAVLQLDDVDEVYSIRITGKRRVFCVHHGHYMRVLWFDPEHKVCISNLKNT